jgi:glycosyltransferase involved in cell wall biosynthesis
MTISVIVATYNRAALLAKCLESLRGQRFENGDEVIVVDNASTDETPAVVERFARIFPIPVVALLEGRAGKTPALAAGITRASGTVLALTDDDVCVDEGWLATIRRLFADPELALLAGRIDPIWERAAPAWLELDRRTYGRLSAPIGLVHYGAAQPLGARTALGANLAIRRDVLDAVGGFASNLGRARGTLLCGEDHELTLRVVAAGYRAVYDPALCVRHWVPAERLRLGYFLRWSLWAGVTHSLLDSQNAGRQPAKRPTRVPRYLWKRAVIAPLRAMTELFRGRTSGSVERLMDAAFAVGYIGDRLRNAARHSDYAGASMRTGRGHAPHAGRLPSARADANPPAVPIPGVHAGNSKN